MGGPSPRVRGTHGLPLRIEPVGRSIPARAGNTPARRISSGVISVHPRACGEHEPARTFCAVNRGPSPRVRGTRQKSGAATSRVRSIPARAGNTPRLGLPLLRLSVHPRACGEHATISRDTTRLTGPSPRVRARACGEHDARTRPARRIDGPSPRVRGTLHVPPRGRQRGRSIPARAGNTSATAPAATEVSVHPRACGEHKQCRVEKAEEHGPSPRVRGTRWWRARRSWLSTPVEGRTVLAAEVCTP